MLETIKVLIYVFMACMGFCIIFNFHDRKNIIFASLGGVLSWFVYLISAGLESDIFRNFIAAIMLTIYSEVMARAFKAPVTGFLLIAIIPLVPGGGIYYTMEYCLSGDTSAFLETGLHTFGIAGSIALAVLLISSAVRLWHMVRISHKNIN